MKFHRLTWKPWKGFQGFPRWSAAGRAGRLPTRLGTLGILAVFTAQACASAKIENAGGSGGSGPGGSGQEGGSGGGSSILTINLDGAVNAPDARKADLAPDAKPYRCDDAGNCNICLAILSLGQPGNYGANSGSTDNTNAFQHFMNSNTSGTANMVMLKSFTSLTDQLLNQYDVVILQALADSVYTDTGLWKFQQSDVDALNKWVTERGGAIIAMSGYGGYTTEVNPLNQLLAPFGISYNTDTIFDSNACPDSLCYCSYGSIPFNNWQSTPDCSGITTNIKPDGTVVTLGKVGLFDGRSINCSGTGCSVFAKDPNTGANVGVGKLVGTGRVFAWADEWVTYTSQWGLLPDPQYDNATTYAQCVGHTPNTSYVVPQFWYNAFKWSVPSAGCFTIDQPADPGQQIVY